MKVGIYTNLDQKCGNAEDARYLYAHLKNICPSDYIFSLSDNLLNCYDCNAVIVNWHPSVVKFFIEDAKWLKERGIKIILIHQNSTSATLHVDGTLSLCDVIVAHEPMGESVTYIPVGIPVVDPLPAPNGWSVGVAGFPFPWKRFDVAAQVAKQFRIKCKMIAPKSPHMDTDSYIRAIYMSMPNLLELHQDWLPIHEVVSILATCTMNVFWYQSQSVDDEYGQTGSARMGIAARRPTIISAHRKFRTLWDYDDELYVAAHEEEVYQYADEIMKDPEAAKKPNRVMQDMGWPTIARKYKEVIDSL